MRLRKEERNSIQVMLTGSLLQLCRHKVQVRASHEHRELGKYFAISWGREIESQ
jgi:hypothetical protein